MKKRSFRTRLLIVMTTVVLVSTTAVALLSRRFTHVELRRARASATGQLRDAIVRAHAEHGSWDDVRGAITQLAMQERTVVVDQSGRIVVAPLPDLTGGTAEHDQDGSWRLTLGSRRIALREGETLDDHGTPIGAVLVLPAVLDEPAPEERIDRWLFWIVVIVGAAGVVVASLIGRSVARPLEDLTDAVDRVARGDRSFRVEASAGGEVAMLARAFNGLFDSLDHQEHLRRTLVSDVAHELRSPLTNVRYQLEAMQDGVLPADATTLASCLEETMRLGQLVDDLQELALADAGALHIHPCELELGVEIGTIVQAATARMQAAQVAIDVDIPRATIYADPARLAQIMRNLLDNAITHTPPGGNIKVTARALASDEVEVRVTDDGSGIASDHLPNVFERFYRADPSRARATGGAGLGLAIVKQLVVAQRGRVWAESTLGVGASFAFTLPMRS